jgi:hypothetical protein
LPSQSFAARLTLGSFMGLSLGVSQLSLRGTLFLAFRHLTPHLPWLGWQWAGRTARLLREKYGESLFLARKDEKMLVMVLSSC